MTLLILFVTIALGASFLCSILEAVLLSVTPGHVGAIAVRTPASGERLRRMKEDIDRPLAAILSLNTIAHTVGAAGAGAQGAKVFGEAYLGAISAVLTLLILFVSEIIPKTLGAVYWRQLAVPVSYVLQPIIWVMWPLVKLSELTKKLIVRTPYEAAVSREEMAAMARLGEQEGVLDEGESRVLESLLRFRTLSVHDIMTPRTVVFALPEDKTVAEVVAQHPNVRFSRIPIYQSSSHGSVTGYVLKDQILLKAAEDAVDTTLRELKRELQVVPETLSLPRLFDRLMARGEHIAMAIDEYGGMAGVVTIEDVVETLLGLEIVDEADSVEDMQQLARDRWRQRAERLGLLEDESLAELLEHDGADARVVRKPVD